MVKPTPNAMRPMRRVDKRSGPVRLNAGCATPFDKLGTDLSGLRVALP
jgi:hypothetical protein